MVLGILGGAGALACMIPAADLLLSTSLLISRNIYVRGFRHNDEHVSPEHMKNVARYLILILTAIALYLSIFHANLLVNLLLTGYAGVTQFFPIIVLGLFWKKASKLGAVCGLIVGEFLVFFLILSKMDPVRSRFGPYQCRFLCPLHQYDRIRHCQHDYLVGARPR